MKMSNDDLQPVLQPLFREQARSYPLPICGNYPCTMNSCRSELARENHSQHPPSRRTFHGKNLRTGRYSEAGRSYLITTVTNQRQKIFTNWQTGRLLAHEFYSPWLQGRAESLAWVIMPDHFHWLLSLHDDGDLSSILRRVKSKSAIALNVLSHQQGRKVWQKGYYDHAVRREEDSVELARYIVANPLRAGLVANINDYPLWDAVWLS